LRKEHYEDFGAGDDEGWKKSYFFLETAGKGVIIKKLGDYFYRR